MKPQHVLIADDKEENLYFLRAMLEGAGYSVESAVHGAEALDLARRTRPDLVVSDILMPVMDGFALCREWKKDADLKSVPFVFYTATYTDERDREFALSLGADEFIVKPQEPDVLLEQLRNVLQTGVRRSAATATPGEPEGVFLRQYNETLIRKLEAKMEQLEQDIAGRKKTEESLRESQEILALFMRHSPIYSFIKEVTATQSRVLMASENYQGMIGIPGSAMVGKTMEELYPPEFAKKISADDWSVVSHGEVLKLDEELDGRHYVTIKFPIVREGRTLLAGYTIDVSDQKKAEMALRESEDRFHDLFSNMTSGVAVYEATADGEDFVFKDINRAGLVIEKADRREVIGKTVTEVFPGVREMGLLEVLRRVWRTGKPEYFPATHYIDGRLSHWYENHVYQLSSGEIVAVYDNVTAQKQAEDKLRQNEERLRLLAKNSSDVLGIIEADGRQRYVSPAAERITGFTPEELQRTAIADVVHPDDLPRVQSVFQDVVAHPQTVYSVQYRHVHKTKGWVCVEAIGQSALNDPSVNGVVISVRDISERILAEEERERMQAHLNQAQKMESVGRLAGGVAHDFNNMLSVILGHVEIATQTLEPEHPLRSDLMEIQKAAERSAGLTRQLLAFARKQTVTPRVLDLNETVEAMLGMLRRLIGEEINLTWLPGNHLATVKMDPSQVDQILANLCVNARDAIGGMGEIIIETGNATIDDEIRDALEGSLADEFVQLTVSDNGCGMDAETRAHLFEPFFTTKEVGEGTGLGLATVYGIVTQNHGFIHVDSNSDQGTTFRMYLPRHLDKEEQIQPNTPTPPVAHGQETILLVEDEPSILNIAKIMLEKLGYRVLAAATPGEALHLAGAHSGEIHLLMTDVVMPEMNGRDLAKNLLSLYPQVRRLFMSGYTADVIAHHGVLDDGTQFIQKPFSMKDLSAKVRETLDRQS